MSPSKNRASNKRPRGTETNDGQNEAPSPVKVITPSPSSTPQDPISLQSSSLLKDILYPLTPGDFMKNHFRQQAVHIQGSPGRREDQQEDESKKAKKIANAKKNKAQLKNSDEAAAPNRYQPIIEEGMYNLNAKDLVKETSSDSVFVWLPMKEDNHGDGTKKNHKNNNPLIQSVEIPEADTAWALHQSGGHSLYCRAPPPVEQVLVAKLLKDTGLGCGQYDPAGESMTSLARGEVEMFITAKPGGKTDWHYDFQENFTLQLSGVKRWTLQQGTVTDPLRACTPHYRAPDVVESQLKAARLSAPGFVFDQPIPSSAKDNTDMGFNARGLPEEVILRPGDAFYFPAGMWHKIEVLEPGVSINISLMATNYANITCQALQHYLLKRDEWRQVVTHNPKASHLNALEHLKGLLKDLPGIIQEFEEVYGGAQAILPPVLLNPPSFQIDSEIDDEDSNGEDEDHDDKNEKQFANQQSKKEGNEEEDEWEEVEMEEHEDDASSDAGGNSEGIIDTWQFQYPTGYHGPCKLDFSETSRLLDSHNLILNPLASLLRMDELTSYYAQHNLKQSRDNDENVFVLNVNYAGVESHESAVRVVLRDHPEERSLNQICETIKQQQQNEKSVRFSQKFPFEPHDKCIPLIHCLLYYGYFILVPSNGKDPESVSESSRKRKSNGHQLPTAR